MLVYQTFGTTTTLRDAPLTETERQSLLNGIIRLWQSNPEKRQSIIEQNAIPLRFESGCVMGKIAGIWYKIEHNDIKDLLLLSEHRKNRGVFFPENEPPSSKAVVKSACAELREVYKILKAQAESA
jgi:hypothetical protein